MEPWAISSAESKNEFRPRSTSRARPRSSWWLIDITTAVAIESIPRRAPRGRIARYARGRDYHKVMKRRLVRLARELGETPAGSTTFVLASIRRRCSSGSTR